MNCLAGASRQQLWLPPLPTLTGGSPGFRYDFFQISTTIHTIQSCTPASHRLDLQISLGSPLHLAHVRYHLPPLPPLLPQAQISRLLALPTVAARRQRMLSLFLLPALSSLASSPALCAFEVDAALRDLSFATSAGFSPEQSVLVLYIAARLRAALATGGGSSAPDAAALALLFKRMVAAATAVPARYVVSPSSSSTTTTTTSSSGSHSTHSIHSQSHALALGADQHGAHGHSHAFAGGVGHGHGHGHASDSSHPDHHHLHSDADAAYTSAAAVAAAAAASAAAAADAASGFPPSQPHAHPRSLAAAVAAAAAAARSFRAAAAATASAEALSARASAGGSGGGRASARLPAHLLSLTVPPVAAPRSGSARADTSSAGVGGANASATAGESAASGVATAAAETALPPTLTLIGPPAPGSISSSSSRGYSTSSSSRSASSSSASSLPPPSSSSSSSLSYISATSASVSAASAATASAATAAQQERSRRAAAAARALHVPTFACLMTPAQARELVDHVAGTIFARLALLRALYSPRFRRLACSSSIIGNGNSAAVSADSKLNTPANGNSPGLSSALLPPVETASSAAGPGPRGWQPLAVARMVPQPPADANGAARSAGAHCDATGSAAQTAAAAASGRAISVAGTTGGLAAARRGFVTPSTVPSNANALINNINSNNRTAARATTAALAQTAAQGPQPWCSPAAAAVVALTVGSDPAAAAEADVFAFEAAFAMRALSATALYNAAVRDASAPALSLAQP